MTHAFIVVAYKESPFLGATLQSLAEQTQKSSILVATSTPNGHIEREAKRFDAEIRINPARRDIAADWNFALSIAPARFVTLAHQDDWYDPDFASESVRMLEKSGCGIGFTGYQEIDDDGRPVSSKISVAKHAIEAAILGRSNQVAGLRLRAFLSFGNPLPCSSVTYDLGRMRDFRFSSSYASNLDWDAWWRLMEAGEIFARSPLRLVGRRHNKLTATSALIASGVRQQEDWAMFKRAWARPFADVIAFAYRASY